MYKAVGSPGSRLTRVVWMLEELGQPYEIVKAKPHSEQMRRYNPSGKAPALVDGELVLTDSAAICVYLGEKHSDMGMASNSLAERALIDSWVHFAQSELEAPLWNKLKHRMLIPEELRVEVGPWTAWEFARDVKALERRLGANSFALGERFSAVDVILGHIGQWARGARFAIVSDTVNAYFDRVLGRPAAARAKMREAEAASAPAA
ncbi:MAG: glutathione S-transferase family protein [Notoacmeibacter sp.]|nr:glutathione S-transferase family protein [Notoacmeibacter sp.]